MRWPSPPERLPEGRSSVRYSRPTSARKFSRSRISLRISLRDFRFLRAQLGRGEKRERLLDRHRSHFGNRFAVEAHEQAFLLEPRAVASRTRPHVHVRLEELAHAFRLGFLVAAIEPLQHALERLRVLGAMVPALVGELDFLAAGAVHDCLAHLGWNVLPRLIEAELVMRRKRVEHRLQIVHRRPRRDRAIGNAQVLVLHDQLGIEVHDRSDPRAFRAGAVRAVEGKHSRLDLRIRNPAIDAREALAEINFALVFGTVQALDLEQVLPVFEGDFERIRQALLDSFANREPIDHHLDGVALILVQHRLLAEFVKFAVDLHAHEARAPHLGQLLAILALAIADDRREHVNPRALGPSHDSIDDLLHALLGDFAAAVVTERVADAREEQAQVVVDFGDGADGRARIARGGLLLDRDRGREPLDRIDVRLFHLLEELARVRRQRFDVAALALGVNRVEGERRLARAGEAGDYDQAVARNLEIDVLEIVLARAFDDDSIGHRSYAAARLRDLFAAHRGAPCIFNRGNHARRICDSLPGDIERGAVIRRSPDERQSDRDIHRAIELQSLERDQPLIVIHRDRRVEIERA